MDERRQLEDAQQVVLLPASPQRKPGPVHSLILDESANYYYTDEINHRVVSLDAAGHLRWQVDGTEFTQGPLRYPRGLAMGWTFGNGSLQRCLAVCDSWNNRIVFLNLAGGPLNQWKAAGDTRFQEVCDIRFMAHPSGAGDIDKNGGYWLALDRGNHRLCGLGLDGRLLFQVGRPLSPSFVWRIPSRDWIEDPTRGIAAFEPYDPAYYPTRIVGAYSEALYLWEPLFRRLNQVLYGNLLPIRLEASCDNWLAADATGILGWCVASRRLRRYASNGELILEISLEGTPIAADLSRKEVWLQEGNRIVRHTWREEAAPNSPKQPELLFPVLRHSAEEDLQLFNLNPADSTPKQYFECIESLLVLADWLVAYNAVHGSGVQAPLPEQSKLDLLINALPEARFEWHRKVTPWHVGVLKWKLTQMPGTKTRPRPFEERIRTEWELLSRPLLAKFREVMRRLDAILLTEWDAWSGETGDGNQDLRTFRARLEGELWGIVNELAQAAGALHGSAKVVDLNPPGDDAKGDHAALLRYPITRQRDNLTLREVARWKLNSEDESLRFPRGLTSSSEGNLFVSFWKSRTILWLDKEGKLLGRLDQPGSAPVQLQTAVGIALDRLSRLWIVDESLNSVLIWDFRNNRSLVVKGEEPEVGGFRGPLGVCEGPEGFMLISDYHNHRIVRISLEGECDVFAGGRGSGPARFQHPGSLYKSKTVQGAGTFLVTDTRNHRIQRLDSSGKFRGEVGGCGLEKGKLVLPLSVAEFDDGALAVSMWHVKRSLVLLSSAGEELGHAAIDYSPGDMLVDERRLLVPDFEESAIRVYERMV